MTGGVFEQLYAVENVISAQKIEVWMREFLREVRRKVPVALVGGSDVAKIVEQMGDSMDEVTRSFDYVFCENGLMAYKQGALFSSKVCSPTAWFTWIITSIPTRIQNCKLVLRAILRKVGTCGGPKFFDPLMFLVKWKLEVGRTPTVVTKFSCSPWFLRYRAPKWTT